MNESNHRENNEKEYISVYQLCNFKIDSLKSNLFQPAKTGYLIKDGLKRPYIITSISEGEGTMLLGMAVRIYKRKRA